MSDESLCAVCAAPQAGIPDCKDHNHWYAATRFDWVVADTKENVIKKLAQISDTEMMKHGGVEALVCRVNLPITAHYKIDEYLPGGVDREPAKRIKILTKSGKFTE